MLLLGYFFFKVLTELCLFCRIIQQRSQVNWSLSSREFSSFQHVKQAFSKLNERLGQTTNLLLQNKSATGWLPLAESPELFICTLVFCNRVEANSNWTLFYLSLLINSKFSACHLSPFMSQVKAVSWASGLKIEFAKRFLAPPCRNKVSFLLYLWSDTAEHFKVHQLYYTYHAIGKFLNCCFIQEKKKLPLQNFSE